MTSIDNVTDVSPRVQYTAAAAQTDFDYSFPIFAGADLTVDVDGVVQTLTTDYAVSGAGNDTGGTVTFVSAPGDGAVVTIYRDIAIERLSDIQQSGPLSSTTWNDEQDKVFLILQELENKIGRAIRFPITSASTNAQAEMAPISNFFGKFLRITSAGILEAAEALDNTVSLTAEVIGALLNPRTAAEIAAGVTPVAYRYVAGNVLRYGVTDNASDDTSKMQDAIDAQGTGGEVNIPPNMTVIITSGLTWKSNLALRIGEGSSIKLKDGSADGPRLIDARGGLTNIAFYGPGKIDGNKDNQTSGNKAHGLAITGTNVIVRDLEVCNIASSVALSMGDGIILEPTIPDDGTQCENVLISNCYIHDIERQGLTLESGLDVRVHNNRFEDIVDSAIDIEPAGATIGDVNGVVISDNYMLNCDDGISIVSATTPTMLQNIKCHNNNMDNIENGYQVRATTNVDIDGGILTNVGRYGVHIFSDSATSTSNTTVKNLSISGTPTHGIFAQVTTTGTHAVVHAEGNKISGTTTWGMAFGDVTGLTVKNNRVTYAAGDGYKVDLCIDIEEDGNIAEYTGPASDPDAFLLTNNTNLTAGRHTAHFSASSTERGVRVQSNTKIVWRGGDDLDEANTPFSDGGSNTSWYGTFSGTFTAANAASTNVSSKHVQTYSRIFITPTNAAAGTLQAGTKALYVNNAGASVNTSFRVTTADGGSAAGTETFNYLIVNANMY